MAVTPLPPFDDLSFQLVRPHALFVYDEVATRFTVRDATPTWRVVLLGPFHVVYWFVFVHVIRFNFISDEFAAAMMQFRYPYPVVWYCVRCH